MADTIGQFMKPADHSTTVTGEVTQEMPRELSQRTPYAEQAMPRPISDSIHPPKKIDDAAFGDPSDADPHDHPGMQALPDLNKNNVVAPLKFKDTVDTTALPGPLPDPLNKNIHPPKNIDETPFGDPNDSDPHDHPGRQALPDLNQNNMVAPLKFENTVNFVTDSSAPAGPMPVPLEDHIHLPKKFDDTPFGNKYDTELHDHPGMQALPDLNQNHMVAPFKFEDTVKFVTDTSVEAGPMPRSLQDYIHVPGEVGFGNPNDDNADVIATLHDHPGQQNTTRGNAGVALNTVDPSKFLTAADPGDPYAPGRLNEHGLRLGPVIQTPEQIDTTTHAANVLAAEAAGNTMAGFANEAATSAWKRVDQMNLTATTPSIAPIPVPYLNSSIVMPTVGITTNNGKISTTLPFDYSKEAFKIAGATSKYYAQKVVQLGIEVGIQRLKNLLRPPGLHTHKHYRLDDPIVIPIDPSMAYVTLNRQYMQLKQLEAQEQSYNRMEEMNWYTDKFQGAVNVFDPDTGKRIRAWDGTHTPRLMRAFDAARNTITTQENETGTTYKQYDPPKTYSATSVQDHKVGYVNEEHDISDRQFIVPLVFTDMRSADNKNRSVYFQPFITNLSEAITPSWNMQNYFGRVDPVATYQSTNRIVNLGFKILSFQRDDLRINQKKIAWLTSMAYPQFASGSFHTGPVIRLRIGNLISSNGPQKSLTGVITALNYSYENSGWELAEESQLPHHITVSLTFHVLHENPIGLVAQKKDGKMVMSFGGISKEGTGDSATYTADIRKFRASFKDGEFLDSKFDEQKLNKDGEEIENANDWNNKDMAGWSPFKSK